MIEGSTNFFEPAKQIPQEFAQGYLPWQMRLPRGTDLRQQPRVEETVGREVIITLFLFFLFPSFLVLSRVRYPAD
jgi:hypothetical protein